MHYKRCENYEFAHRRILGELTRLLPSHRHYECRENITLPFPRFLELRGQQTKILENTFFTIRHFLHT